MILVENVLSTVQFPGHTVTAEEEATGHEVFRVANGRRSRFDYWTPTTANSDTHLTAVFDRVRAFNMVVLDRGHNLAGHEVELRSTSDATDFSGTFETPVSVTIATGSLPGHVDDGQGVVTEEGAWLQRFPVRVGHAIRLFVPAMGTDLRPEIVGLWIGLALELEYLTGAFDEDQQALLVSGRAESDHGWVGHTARTLRREGEIRLRAPDFLSYDQIRYHLRGHYLAHRPMWAVHDQAQADRSLLVVPPPGQQRIALGESDWGWRSGPIGYQEWEPRRVA